MMPKPKKSECCGAEVTVQLKKSYFQGIEWEDFTCQKCGQPCDLIDDEEEDNGDLHR